MSLPNVPSHLTIRVLHSDDDIVVIDKPCDLRSVPGHANPPPPEKERPRSNTDSEPTSHRRTAQEAWVKAIQSMSADGGGTNITVTGQINLQGISMEYAAAREVIRNLGTSANPSGVPRKLETFVKYCHRNSRRLLPSFMDLREDRVECEPRQKKQKTVSAVSSKMRDIARLAYSDIQHNQRRLMNLPTPTADWESAIGQLRMLGFGDYSNCVSTVSEDSGNAEKRDPQCSRQSIEAKLHVVHRLDCQVSAVLLIVLQCHHTSPITHLARRSHVHCKHLESKQDIRYHGCRKKSRSSIVSLSCVERKRNGSKDIFSSCERLASVPSTSCE